MNNITSQITKRLIETNNIDIIIPCFYIIIGSLVQTLMTTFLIRRFNS